MISALTRLIKYLVQQTWPRFEPIQHTGHGEEKIVRRVHEENFKRPSVRGCVVIWGDSIL